MTKNDKISTADLFKEYQKLHRLTDEARIQVDESIATLEDIRQQRNEAWRKYADRKKYEKRRRNRKGI